MSVNDKSTIEAIFLAVADPSTASRFYAQGLGLGEPDVTPDGQYAFTSAGVFFAVEPVQDAPGATDGQFTVWYRVGNVPEMVDRLVAHGASVLEPPGAGDEVVAVVLAPGRHRIGLIGSA